jgi:hypothetical protein
MIMRGAISGVAVTLASLGAAAVFAGTAQAATAAPAAAAPAVATTVGYATNAGAVGGSGNLAAFPAQSSAPCSLTLVYGNCASSDPVLTYNGDSPYGACATQPITIDWKDGNTPDTTAEESPIGHRYLAAGLYHITVTSACMGPSTYDFTYTGRDILRSQ